ncbi:MAG: hypothetical protein NTZ09_08270 [Candidatus Hydrogenedentes bacterium]|nr:hypothetical protein [Candidatus Hydrogenedentota bacterium]
MTATTLSLKSWKQAALGSRARLRPSDMGDYEFASLPLWIVSAGLLKLSARRGTFGHLNMWQALTRREQKALLPHALRTSKGGGGLLAQKLRSTGESN